MTKIVGLTGGIASGKSTVAKMFFDKGIPVIDTDQIAHDLLEKGTQVYHEVIRYFSSDIVLTDQSINRKQLGRIIFANKAKREILNSIVHPHVIAIVEAELNQYIEHGEEMVVVDVPLLFESGFDERCDKTIVVYTSPQQQLSRLIGRDVIKKEFAQMKIDSQMPLSKKVDLADYVINNSFSILRTKKDFNKIIKDLGVK